MADIKVGERVALSLDPQRIHLFDAEGRQINTQQHDVGKRRF
jgi:hypothetical protein